MKKLANKYFYLASFGLFGFIFFHLARQTLQIKSSGWYVGHVNLYGDLVYHLALINKFSLSNTILIDNPIYANDKINYPPLPDYITSIVSSYTGIDFALFITTFLVGLLSIYVARLFILNVFKNEKIVFLSLLLFFFNGGLGFYYFFIDYFSSGQNLFSFLLNMPNTYTQLKDIGYYWINNYLAYFLPQRSFLFAFPVTLVTLLLLLYGHKKSKTHYFLLAGVLAGSLPLLQAHSLLVLFILSFFYAPLSIFTSQNKLKSTLNWAVFGLSTIIIAFPLFSLISSIRSPVSFIKLDIGWVSEENLLWFWLKNLGIFLPTYLFALIYFLRKKSILMLHLPFLAIFIIANILVFQPWDFDNGKLLIDWYFSASILTSYFIYDIFFTENTWRKIVGSLIVFLIIFSATLDIFRTFTKVSTYEIFSQTDLMVAESVKQLTPQDAVFITATNHNHPIPVLSGRSTLLGFTGWVWSHGIEYTKREEDIKNIYLGGEEANNLIKNYKVSYVTVGPQELQSYSINESYFKNFPELSLAQGWVIYDVSSIWSNSNR